MLLGLVYEGAKEIVQSEMTVSLAGDYHEALGGGGGGGDEGEQALIESFEAELPAIATDELAAAVDADAIDEPLADFNEFSTTPLADAPIAASLPQLDFTGVRSLGSGGGAGGGVGAGRGTGNGSGVGPGSGHGQGGKFVYVFDRSESMNSVFTYFVDGARSASITPLDAAKAELLRSLGDLGDSHYFQIVFYNDEPVTFGGSLSLSSASLVNKQLADSFVSATTAEGNTNHGLALDMALQCDPEMIFLLTDGEAKDDLTHGQIRRLTRYCRGKKIKINVAHFCFKPRVNCTLIELAEKTGGQHRFITLRELAHEKAMAMTPLN